MYPSRLRKNRCRVYFCCFTDEVSQPTVFQLRTDKVNFWFLSARRSHLPVKSFFSTPMQTAQNNRRRRRQVKEAAVEKKGVRHNSPITKARWHICGCSRSLRSFLGWRKPGLGTADVSEKATVRKSEKSASHRPRTCQRNNCPRSFKANRNICLDITSPDLRATN